MEANFWAFVYDNRQGHLLAVLADLISIPKDKHWPVHWTWTDSG